MSVRRLGIFGLALFQALFLNVFIPVHTRGQIVMPGAAAAGVRACCAGEEGPAKRSSDGPSKGRAANCAICAFAAHLMVAAPVDLAPRPTNLVCLREEPGAGSVTTVELVLAYLGRAPPVG